MNDKQKRGPGRPRKPRTETPEARERRIAHLRPFTAGHATPAAHTPAEYETLIAACADEFPAYFFPGKSPDEAAERLEDPQTLRGLLLYIHQHVFKPGATLWGSNIDYNDTMLLDFIFAQYLLLCARYSQIPNIGNYCIMTGITEQIITDWKTGKTRNNTATNRYSYSDTMLYSTNNNIYDSTIYSADNNINSVNDIISPSNDNQMKGYNKLTHQLLVDKWINICRTALEDQTGKKNSVGSMFLLKAVHGYRDSAPVQIEIAQAAPRESAQAIAARYADEERPQLPGNSDNLTDN
jgi:hypothetical protein